MCEHMCVITFFMFELFAANFTAELFRVRVRCVQMFYERSGPMGFKRAQMTFVRFCFVAMERFHVRFEVSFLREHFVTNFTLAI